MNLLRETMTTKSNQIFSRYLCI